VRVPIDAIAIARGEHSVIERLNVRIQRNHALVVRPAGWGAVFFERNLRDAILAFLALRFATWNLGLGAPR
jgi:hypothetical protein